MFRGHKGQCRGDDKYDQHPTQWKQQPNLQGHPVREKREEGRGGEVDKLNKDKRLRIKRDRGSFLHRMPFLPHWSKYMLEPLKEEVKDWLTSVLATKCGNTHSHLCTNYAYTHTALPNFYTVIHTFTWHKHTDARTHGRTHTRTHWQLCHIWAT